jgi:hypothetical protein
MKFGRVEFTISGKTRQPALLACAFSETDKIPSLTSNEVETKQECEIVWMSLREWSLGEK